MQLLYRLLRDLELKKQVPKKNHHIVTSLKKSMTKKYEYVFLSN